jgi:hypothetical protein
MPRASQSGTISPQNAAAPIRIAITGIARCQIGHAQAATAP